MKSSMLNSRIVLTTILCAAIFSMIASSDMQPTQCIHRGGGTGQAEVFTEKYRYKIGEPIVLWGHRFPPGARLRIFAQATWKLYAFNVDTIHADSRGSFGTTFSLPNFPSKWNIYVIADSVSCWVTVSVWFW